jgi:hypothetical protein
MAGTRCVGDPDAVMLETWKSWLLTMQVHSAVFAATFTDQDTVTCKIRQEEWQPAATGPQFYLNAGTWLRLLSGADLPGDGPPRHAGAGARVVAA